MQLQFSPPTLSHTLREVFAPLEWLQTAAQIPTFSQLPRGDGRAVLLLPGYMADEWSMRPLKLFLQKLNYTVDDWGQGRNRGNVDTLIERVAEHMETLPVNNVSTDAAPFTLIGWSLGGVIARELARLFPHMVREVITLGSPITGGPKYTAVASRYARREKLDLDAFEQHVLSRNQLGFSQPVTSIYSKRDGIVGWQAALDIYNDHAVNIEVDASHLGIGINATVWRIIANILDKTKHK